MTAYRTARQLVRSRDAMLIQFTASEKWIVFPVPMDDQVAALAVINRETNHRMLVFSGRHPLGFPQLSADGKRLLVVRGMASTGAGQLLSCVIEDWRCRILTNDADRIRWPVEVEKDVVLYVAAQPFGKRVSYDFYLVDTQLISIRLSEFRFYALHAPSVSGDKMMFSAFASLSPLFPGPGSMSDRTSDIWMLQADWKEKRLIMPTQQLERLYRIDGYSLLPSLSRDGSHVAFINGRLPAGQSGYRYNLVVAQADGTIKRYVKTTAGRGFSRPAFVGSTVLANQLLGDRYETTLVELESNATRQIASLHHTPGALDGLEHKELVIAE